MTTCMVLRCNEPGFGPIPLSGEEWGPVRFEGVVCQAHYERIQAGEPWCVDAEPPVIGGADGVAAILMDKDLVEKGLHEVVSVTTTMDALYHAPALGRYAKLTLTVRTFGSDQEESIDVVLSASSRKWLMEALSDLRLGDEETE